jgi:hypothetical protein
MNRDVREQDEARRERNRRVANENRGMRERNFTVESAKP